MKKILLCSRRLIEELKNDENYAGSIYLESPTDDLTIDVNNIPDDIGALYVLFNSRYMFFLWQNYEKLAHLKIYLIDTLNGKNSFYAYPSYLKFLELEIFDNLVINAVTDIYLVGKNEESRYLYDYLMKYQYTLIQIDSDDFISLSYNIKSDSIIINCSQELGLVSEHFTVNNFVLNGEIRQIIGQLSTQNISLTEKDFIDFILGGYEITRYNPFAAVAYLYQNNLPQSHKKSIAFYAPTCAYRNNLLTNKIYLNLSNTCDTYFFYGTQCNDRFEKLDNSFSVENGLIGYFEFLDLIIYPALDLVLPKTPKKLYMLHDIYDSPTGHAEAPIKCNKTGELKVSPFFGILDYAFLPSASVMPKGSVADKLQKNICYIPGGYFKLDGNIKRFQEYAENNVDSIIYAPTVINNIFRKHHSQSIYGVEIVRALLNNFSEYNIIFRPHPHSISNPHTIEIVNEFQDHPRFVFDNNPSDYIQNYSRSKLMVTDISGTAFTYAFTTLRPVVFFSVDEKNVEADMGGVSYFRDRSKIGSVVESIDELVHRVTEYLTNYKDATKSVEEFRKVSVFNVESSEDYFMNNISYILDNVKHPDWTYIEWEYK